MTTHRDRPDPDSLRLTPDDDAAPIRFPAESAAGGLPPDLTSLSAALDALAASERAEPAPNFEDRLFIATRALVLSPILPGAVRPLAPTLSASGSAPRRAVLPGLLRVAASLLIAAGVGVSVWLSVRSPHGSPSVAKGTGAADPAATLAAAADLEQALDAWLTPSETLGADDLTDQIALLTADAAELDASFSENWFEPYDPLDEGAM